MMVLLNLAHDRSARSVTLAAGSTTAFVLGGASVAGAVVLWLTAPARARTSTVRAAPVAGVGVLGASVEGAF